MRGRKKRPDFILELTGEVKKDRYTGDLPVLNNRISKIDKLPDPPDWFSETMRRTYEHKGNLLVYAGILNETNFELFLLYITSVCRAFEEEKIINELYKKKKYIEAMKLERVAMERARNAKMLGSEFGLTPASSLKVRTAEKTGDPFEDYLNDSEIRYE